MNKLNVGIFHSASLLYELAPSPRIYSQQYL